MKPPLKAAYTVSWFEFLLNPTLLEDHLSKEFPEPSATDLIIQFLANALLPKDRELTTFPPVTVLPIDKSETNGSSPEESCKESTQGDSKKVTALKLLALKVAAYLNWDLNMLQANLPINMQNSLLLFLLNVSLGGEDSADSKRHAECDLEVLSDQSFFAINLFHRWSARMISPEPVSARPSNRAPVAVPGSQDPTVVSPVIVETIMKSVYDRLELTRSVLEKCLAVKADVRIPSHNSFGTLCEDRQDVEFFWERGTLVNNKEIVCQTAFDLGCLYFFKREYLPAGRFFFQALDLFALISNPTFCRVDDATLKGYCAALGGLLKKQSILMSRTLLERLNEAVSGNFKDIVPVLTLDNMKREIGLAYREETLANLHTLRSKMSATAFSEIYFHVFTLNVIRMILDGRPFSHEYVKAMILRGEAGAKFLHDCVVSVNSQMNATQRTNIANFIKYICKVTYRITPEVSRVLNNAEILGSELLNLRDGEEVEQPFDDGLSYEQIQRDLSDHIALQLGELEVQLMSSYEPRVIYDLIPRLHNFGPHRPAWLITKRWELPNPFHGLILDLNQGYSQEAVYVLTAKAKELARLKCYTKARRLLEMVDREVSDSSFKLTRLVRWEMLHMDLLHARSMIGIQAPDEAWVLDLVKQVKICITIFLQEKGSDFAPRQEIIQECAVYLLNFQQWDYLTTLDVGGRNFFEFLSILARTCAEVKANKGGRKALRELWDAVLPMFANAVISHKRNLGGLPSLVARDMPYVILSRNEFNQYLEKLKDNVVLSVLISLLSKIHNILKDDVNNSVTTDLIITWPAGISNSSVFGIRLVQESLSLLLNHALSVYPVSIAWIRAKGDLSYVLGQHANALRCYVEAAMVSSGHFADPIPRSVFDESSIRRMIRCCSQLQCYTQAAVLCQFLDDVDHTMAFKALQEKNAQDAMDAYYECIWDLNILEFLVHIHTKRGELSKRDYALKIIGQLELNANNNVEIQREAANVRKNRFMRAMVRQYL